MTGTKNIRVSVLGATGFTGEKLVELLLKHPKIDLTYLASRTRRPVPYGELFPTFAKKTSLLCEPFSIPKAIAKSDVVFLSLPHTVSMQYAGRLLKRKKLVIDLSADYRIKDHALYKQFYKASHKDRINLKHAVYGAPELFCDAIAKAKLIANPGCYPTALVLGLYPALKERLASGTIVACASSSITGAGRKALLEYHYSNIADNIWGYKAFEHQHLPEVIAILKKKAKVTADISFLPQVVGVDAGIYATIHCKLTKKMTQSQLYATYAHHYKRSPFVRVRKTLPKLKEVVGTNFCDIGFAVSSNGRKMAVYVAIDNLIKGAAGSAIQNMNIMLGLDQTTGLL